MTDRFKWDGPTLSGPIEALIAAGAHGVTLPPGPPESAPFDGEWFMGLEEKRNGKVYEFWHEWGENVTRVRDVGVVWKLEDGRQRNQVPALKKEVHIGCSMTDTEYTLFNSTITYSDHPTLGRHIKAKSKFSMTVICPPLAGLTRRDKAQAVNQLLFEQMVSPFSCDVKLRFPAIGVNLWSKIDFLRARSPYFDRLFEGVQLPEVVAASTSLKQESSPDPTQIAVALDPEIATSTPDQFEHLSVTITNLDPDTFAATLLHSDTGHITYLASSPKPHAALERPAKRTRTSASASSATATATGSATPPPQRPPAPAPRPAASWQAAMLAADKFGIEGLSFQGVQVFKDRLTVQNVVGELFGPLSRVRAELREAALDFAARNYAEVKETAAMKDKLRRAKEDQAGAEAKLVLELISRL